MQGRFGMKFSMIWKSFTLLSSVAFYQGERCVSSSCSRVESRALEYFARELGQLQIEVPMNFFVQVTSSHSFLRVDVRFPIQPPLRRKSLLEAGKQQMDIEVIRSRWKVTSDPKLLKNIVLFTKWCLLARGGTHSYV